MEYSRWLRGVVAGTGKLDQMGDMSANVIGLDWATSMRQARDALGGGVQVQGNVDPMVLFAPEEQIREAVAQCLADGGPGHILNVGHGVAQGTPEENVGLFCRLAHESGKAAVQSEQLAAAASV